MPSPDHSFTLQAVMEMHKSQGRIEHALEALKGTVDGLKTKVDDLTNWKNRILGGAMVLGAVIAALSFIVGKGWPYVAFRSPQAQQQSSVVPAIAPPSATVLPSAPLPRAPKGQ